MTPYMPGAGRGAGSPGDGWGGSLGRAAKGRKQDAEKEAIAKPNL